MGADAARGRRRHGAEKTPNATTEVSTPAATAPIASASVISASTGPTLEPAAAGGLSASTTMPTTTSVRSSRVSWWGGWRAGAGAGTGSFWPVARRSFSSGPSSLHR